MKKIIVLIALCAAIPIASADCPDGKVVCSDNISFKFAQSGILRCTPMPGDGPHRLEGAIKACKDQHGGVKGEPVTGNQVVNAIVHDRSVGPLFDALTKNPITGPVIGAILTKKIAKK